MKCIKINFIRWNSRCSDLHICDWYNFIIEDKTVDLKFKAAQNVRYLLKRKLPIINKLVILSQPAIRICQINYIYPYIFNYTV